MTCHHGPGIVICDGITGDWEGSVTKHLQLCRSAEELDQ